jgi:hypothetical protein
MVRSHNEDAIAVRCRDRARRARRRHGRLQRRRGRQRHGDRGDHARSLRRCWPRRSVHGPTVTDEAGKPGATRLLEGADHRQGQHHRSSRRRKASRSTRAWARRWSWPVPRQQCSGCAHRRLAALPPARRAVRVQVTRDHSLLQEQIDSGMITAEEDARRSQNKNLVTRALGIDPEVEPEIHDLRCPAGRHLPALFGRAERHGRQTTTSR